MPTKFPSDIPKFEGKPGEDPGDHVTNFHLWCSSNSLRDDSVQLHLFQCTLIGGAVKWYIELDRSRYSYFNDLEMVFLNHFQLPVRYDVDTELLANFEKTKADHISDHIREWWCRKRLIKVQVPPSFLLEWFLKSLVPCISKDVATSRVFSEEEVIMRVQQLELIYSQSDMLYEIFPDVSWSILDKAKKNSGPHADGIVGSVQSKSMDLLSNQLQQLSIQQTVANQTSSSVVPPTQTSDVHSVQSTNPKANQQPEGKKKQWNKKGKGDKKATNNVGGGKMEKKKSKYLCNLCMEDHLTHLCPRLVEAQKLLVQQQPVVLMNPFPQGKNMAQASTSSSATGGSQGPPAPTNNNPTTNIYMMNVEANIATRARDYGMSESVEKGKEAMNPPTPLQIEKAVGEMMTHIPKGVFKKASHNPNVRAAQNYSVVEDLAQTPCVMSSLEVLQSFPSQRKSLVIRLGIDRDL
jgi:hypothetical protein